MEILIQFLKNFINKNKSEIIILKKIINYHKENKDDLIQYIYNLKINNNKNIEILEKNIYFLKKIKKII